MLEAGEGTESADDEVERFLSEVRQSIESAIQPFVFQANDGKTWTAVLATVNHLLRELWQQGRLLGASEGDAFRARCGLGTTMTEQDLRDGYLIVQVVLQVRRPSEYFELIVKQRMAG